MQIDGSLIFAAALVVFVLALVFAGSSIFPILLAVIVGLIALSIYADSHDEQVVGYYGGIY